MYLFYFPLCFDCQESHKDEVQCGNNLHGPFYIYHFSIVLFPFLFYHSFINIVKATSNSFRERTRISKFNDQRAPMATLIP